MKFVRKLYPNMSTYGILELPAHAFTHAKRLENPG